MAVLAVAVGTGCGISQLWEPSRGDVLRRILPASVQIVVEQQEGRRLRTGSGVVLASGRSNRGNDCFILTTGHTVSDVSGQKQVSVVFGRHRGEDKKVPAVLLAYRDDPDLDVAVLRTENDQCLPALPGHAPTLGESVWVVGFPWGSHMTLASGVVSQIVVSPLKTAQPANPEPASRLMIDASVSYGASGGGVFEARSGRLIGIVESYGTARVTSHGANPPWYIDVPVPGQTYVTPLADIKRFLLEVGHGDLLDIGAHGSAAGRGAGSSHAAGTAQDF